MFEAVLQDAGVRVKRDNFAGFAHYFWSFPLPKANAKLWQTLADGIKRTLEEEHSHPNILASITQQSH